MKKYPGLCTRIIYKLLKPSGNNLRLYFLICSAGVIVALQSCCLGTLASLYLDAS
jgi:hypothetical protein